MDRRTETQVGSVRHTLALALVLALVVLAALAAPALAAPTEPTISLADLEAKLASGPMTGYFLTVVGGATQDPQQIPATVLSVVADQTVDGSLILFEASGPVIDKAGGVASGMSGSPLYVDDGGVFKLAGAVSYGPAYSALALATPIEYMSAMETVFPVKGATSVTLARPVGTTEGTVSEVTIAPSRRVAERVRQEPGRVVMAPLSTVAIGGLPASSPAYKKVAARLAKHGLDAVPGGAPRTGGAAFSTPFVPGASLAAMIVTGDAYMGGFGTATYVDGDVVVGFGHPLVGGGPSGFDLANALVYGVWPGDFGPEKIFSPGAVAGTITQDRSAGIAGRLDTTPTQVPITSTVAFGGNSVTSTSAMPQWAIDSFDWSYLADAAPFVAMLKATRQDYLEGSATTTTTLVVSDGTTDHTLTLDNLWDDSYDVISTATGDLDNALYALTSNQDGIAPATIKSVNFNADLSPVYKGARILDFSVPGGLKAGVNQVRTTVAAYGNAQLQTVTTSLTIPKGMARSGFMEVYGPMDGGDFFSGDFGFSGDTTAPQTVADIVAELQSAPKNSDLQVVFTPARPLLVPPPAVYPITDVTVSTPTSWALSGYLEKDTGEMSLRARSWVVRGGRVTLGGEVSAAGNTTVRIYKRAAGKTSDTLIATVPARLNDRLQAHFSYRTGSLKVNTRFTVVWDGDAQSLGATASRLVRVVPR